MRLPPHGGSGLKSSIVFVHVYKLVCLPPHGGSGLKSNPRRRCENWAKSPSTRREWIEMENWRLRNSVCASPSTRREWIEIYHPDGYYTIRGGLPPHGGSGLK